MFNVIAKQFKNNWVLTLKWKSQEKKEKFKYKPKNSSSLQTIYQTTFNFDAVFI